MGGTTAATLCRPPWQQRGPPARTLLAHAALRPQEQQKPEQQLQAQQQQGLVQRLAAGTAVLAATATLVLSSPALASDTAAVGSCLLQKCQSALANCLTDGQCASNLVCLQLCNGAEDETACQARRHHFGVEWAAGCSRV